MQPKPISFKDACQFIKDNHRHHTAPQGHKYSISVVDDNGEILGVVMVGRPLARRLDDGFTAEVTRLCTLGGKNVCSLLYSKAAQAAKAMGYRKIITFILDEEIGSSLKASGFKFETKTPGKSWSVPSRPREDKHPIGIKQRWGRDL